jgi:glyoxylase-like metal-dependent hydrolase (beta-lactamase superfamily II)
MISEGGSLERYRETLERLRPVVEAVDTVVPGHGAPQSRQRAVQILTEDLQYLNALATSGADAPLPQGRRGATQRAIHERNAAAS